MPDAPEKLELKHFFGDGERVFTLSPDLIQELERKTNAGIGLLCKRVFSGSYHHADLLETIRLALIGGGESPQVAASLTHIYAANRPLSEVLPLAVAILSLVSFGDTTAPMNSRDSVQLIALTETRDAPAHPTLECVEVRFSPVDDGRELEGIAVRFDVIDAYRTSFDRNAFKWEGRSLPLLWSHDRSQVLGSVRSITPDREGLRIKAKLNLDVQRAREVRSMLAAGDINGLSIGFQRIKDQPRPGGIRHITEARLREVSVVAMPAVPGSNVTNVRSTGDLSNLTNSIRAAINTLKG